ncbi:hypothetical protein TNCV_3957921 [Trichonephila clavipes]|nr:hypothetical protein TNCV_3957921 [Trichonephila clavipes]
MLFSRIKARTEVIRTLAVYLGYSVLHQANRRTFNPNRLNQLEPLWTPAALDLNRSRRVRVHYQLPPTADNTSYSSEALEPANAV